MFVRTGGFGTRLKKQLADRTRNRKIKGIAHFNASGRTFDQCLPLLGKEMSGEFVRIEARIEKHCSTGRNYSWQYLKQRVTKRGLGISQYLLSLGVAIPFHGA